MADKDKIRKGSGGPHPGKERTLSIKFGGHEGETKAAPLKFEVGGDERRYEVYKEEVLASHMMKQLTQKYGTRGKSAKFIFLQAFEEELRGGGKGAFAKKATPRIPASCNDADQVEAEPEDQDASYAQQPPMSQKELALKAGNLNFALGEMMVSDL
jgi:hypothetical protein